MKAWTASLVSLLLVSCAGANDAPPSTAPRQPLTRAIHDSIGDAGAPVVDAGGWIAIARDRKGEENPGRYVQDARGGPLTVVQHTPGVQAQLQLIADDDESLVYRANDVKPNSYVLYRWNRTTKKREVVFDQEGIWNVADHRPDEKLLLEKEVGSNMSELFEWDPAAKSLTPLFGQGEREDYRARYGAKPGESAYDAGAASVGMASLVMLLENTAPYRRILRTRGSAPDVRRAREEEDPRGARDLRGRGARTQKRDNRVLEIGHILRFFQDHLLRSST